MSVDLRGSYGDAIRLEIEDPTPKITNLPAFKYLQQFVHPRRRIRLLLVHEFHRPYAITRDKDLGDVPEVLFRTNPISKLYRRVYRFLENIDVAPTQFLGLVEIEAQSDFLYGGATFRSEISSLELARLCMLEIERRFQKQARPALVMNADLRDITDASQIYSTGDWDSLSSFAYAHQQPDVYFGQEKCDETVARLRADLRSVGDILAGSSIGTDLDKDAMDFLKRASQFFRKPFASTWKSTRSLHGLVKSQPELSDLLLQMRQVYPRIAVEADRALEKANALCDVGVYPTPRDLAPFTVMASLTSRVMDLNILKRIVEAPEDTYIVVHCGAAHSAAIAWILMIWYDFVLESHLQSVPALEEGEFVMTPILGEDMEISILAERLAELVRGNQAKFTEIANAVLTCNDFGDVTAYLSGLQY